MFSTGVRNRRAAVASRNGATSANGAGVLYRGLTLLLTLTERTHDSARPPHPAPPLQKKEFFPQAKIRFEGPTSTNPLAFKHYNAEEVVAGRKMKDWCRFAVCYWHTFRGLGADPFGGQTIFRAWDDGSNR